MKKKLALMITIISCLVFTAAFTLTGCGGNSSGEIEPNEGSWADEELEENKYEDEYDETWKEAYKQVLEDNRAAIEEYTWQADSLDESDYEPKQVALYDINNDEIPELFFFTAGTLGENTAALLNIYTYSDGKAKRMEYACMTNSGEMTEDGFYDEMVSAGVAYDIVSFKDKSGFAIYFSFSYDIANEGRFVAYEVDGDTIKVSKRLQYDELMLNEYEDGVEPEYFIDGEYVSYDEFCTEMNALFEKNDELIMNSYEFFEPRMWDHMSTHESKGMTYSDAIAALS